MELKVQSEREKLLLTIFRELTTDEQDFLLGKAQSLLNKRLIEQETTTARVED